MRRRILMSADAELAERYWGILREYLEHSDEALLNRGYEFARKAMVDGCGVLELADIHQRALRRLWSESRPYYRLFWGDGKVIAESLSPFPVSHPCVHHS